MDEWLEERGAAWEDHKAVSANSEVTLQTIAARMDKLKQFCGCQQGSVPCGFLTGAAESSLAEIVLGFGRQHGKLQEEFECRVRAGSQSPQPAEREQFKAKVLCLMVSLGMAVLRAVHARNTEAGTSVPPIREPHAGDAVTDPEAAHYALEMLAEILVATNMPESAAAVQQHCLSEGLVQLLSRMWGIPREMELLRYAEGYRSLIVRVIANLVYGCPEAAQVVKQEGMLDAVLGATRIDEENPGIREWAAFCIRNLCADPSVQQHIKELRAQRLDPVGEEIARKAGVRPVLETGDDGRTRVRVEQLPRCGSPDMHC
eukprot:TRINITY_DN32219_c0_g1_i1.p1 TRINITY_DN32219_c0_g1~~TRINITY_DN32219_c0_g1_i1.p1  ORF type:complete len:316 (+),score=77.12 TRINITY_DN32219_c0_g1_i1:78-1025(+)